MGKVVGLLALLIAIAFFTGMSAGELGSMVGDAFGNILNFIANVASSLSGSSARG
jgi:hypothetical protein